MVQFLDIKEQRANLATGRKLRDSMWRHAIPQDVGTALALLLRLKFGKAWILGRLLNSPALLVPSSPSEA
jgi:hypothetical protein